MLLLLDLAYFLTFLSLLLSAGLGLALARQRKRVVHLESELREVRRGRLEAFHAATDPEFERRVFEGLKVAIQIRQDHELPVFAQLLRDRLISEDAAPVIAAQDAPADSFDLLVKGDIGCNGYTETYYSANLQCLDPGGPLLAINEKPPQGARQVNLANELVTRLKRELEEKTARQERLRAISQLRGESD